MMKFLFALLFFTSQASAVDVKISQLPLGSAATTAVNDSFPYVKSATNVTQRLTLYDLINLPPMVSTYAPKTSPTFVGTVTATTFSGALSGNATTATALATNPSDCSSNQYATTIAANGNLTCAQVQGVQLTAVGSSSGDVLTSTGSGTAPAWTAPAGAGANTTLSNLGTTAINADMNPAGQNTTDIGKPSKIWRRGYIGLLRNSLDFTVVDVEQFLLKDGGGGDAFSFADTTNITIWKNLIPFSGSTNTIGASGNNMGHLWSTKIGRGTVEFTIPNAAGTAGQVLTNDGSAVSTWGSGPITARAHNSATTINGTLATVVWTTEDFDNTNSLSSGVFTCPENGKYQVNAFLALSGTFALNNTTVMEIQVNGTAVSNITHYSAAAVTNEEVDIEDVVSCSASDTIRIQVSNSGLTPAIVNSDTRNYFSIARVGTL